MTRVCLAIAAFAVCGCTGAIDGAGGTTSGPAGDAGAGQRQTSGGSCVSDPDKPGSVTCDWSCTTANGVTTCSKGTYDVPGGSTSEWSCTDQGEFTQCTSTSDGSTTGNPGWDCQRDGGGPIVCTNNTPDQPPGGGTWSCVYDDVSGVVCTSTDSPGGGSDAGVGQDDGGTLPPQPELCTNDQINNEPEILLAYSPASGQTVGAGGQIKVWVTDEMPPFIAANEQVDLSTGVITAPGDRSAKAGDGYLWEPALYIAPDSAENGGTPHFPVIVKGHFCNHPPIPAPLGGLFVPGMDPPPPGSGSLDSWTAEFIWDVNSLGLAPGSYIAEFVIHDGDSDRGVGCITINIQ